jgi:hypothetical protein
MDRKGKGKMDPADAVEYPNFPSFDLGIFSTPVPEQKHVGGDSAGVAEQTESDDKDASMTKAITVEDTVRSFISHYKNSHSLHFTSHNTDCTSQVTKSHLLINRSQNTDHSTQATITMVFCV